MERSSKPSTFAERHVLRFEKLAVKQHKLAESKRDRKKLAKSLAAAIHYSNAAEDIALRKRVLRAARPLIRESPLFIMKDPAWTISVEGKVYSMGKCVDACRAANPPGVARELCESACALWIWLCGGSEPPERP